MKRCILSKHANPCILDWLQELDKHAISDIESHLAHEYTVLVGEICDRNCKVTELVIDPNDRSFFELIDRDTRMILIKYHPTRFRGKVVYLKYGQTYAPYPINNRCMWPWTYVSSIPPLMYRDAWAVILSHIPFIQLMQLRLVCRDFNTLITSKDFLTALRQQFLLYFPELQSYFDEYSLLQGIVNCMSWIPRWRMANCGVVRAKRSMTDAKIRNFINKRFDKRLFKAAIHALLPWPGTYTTRIYTKFNRRNGKKIYEVSIFRNERLVGRFVWDSTEDRFSPAYYIEHIQFEYRTLSYVLAAWRVFVCKITTRGIDIHTFFQLNSVLGMMLFLPRTYERINYDLIMSGHSPYDLYDYHQRHYSHLNQ